MGRTAQPQWSRGGLSWGCTSLYLNRRKFALSSGRMAPLLTELQCLLDLRLAPVWL